MGNVVTLSDAVARARAVKARLWNPPNAKHSSELDVVSDDGMRKRRAAVLLQQEEIKRAEEDFKRRARIDDLMRDALAERLKAKQIAVRLMEEEIPEPLPIGRILKTVSAYYGISTTDLLSARRTRDIIRPRQIAMYLCREHTTCSLPMIGRRIGGRDHTTILHGWRKIRWLIDDGETRLSADIDNIKWELGIR